MNHKFANRAGYTDITPYEVIRVISAKTLEVREMSTERDPTWMPIFVPGGFAGHCTNQNTQRWSYASDSTNPPVRIRLSNKGYWKDAHGGVYHTADSPKRFYDYNF